jgi:hypothetical protein
VLAESFQSAMPTSRALSLLHQLSGVACTDALRAVLQAQYEVAFQGFAGGHYGINSMYGLLSAAALLPKQRRARRSAI